MSDEEENDDVFVRHTPSYRSNLLNNFIKKLDDRCEKANSSHPRKERVLGTPVEKAIQHHSKPWMINKEFSCSEDSTPMTEDDYLSDELF